MHNLHLDMLINYYLFKNKNKVKNKYKLAIDRNFELFDKIRQLSPTKSIKFQVINT